MRENMDLNPETVQIPVEKMHVSDIRTNKTHESILIIDDAPANIGSLFDYLQAVGFSILIAQDGVSGLQKAEYAQPDLILLDIMMPGLDGFETCRRLKLNPKTKDIPVIFMTALSDTPYTLKGFALGAVDYVTKPIQQEEVLARINAQLTVNGFYKALKEKNQQLSHINDQLEEEIRKRKLVERALEKANETLRKLAALDGLTGIANRRVFDEQLDKEWQRLSRHASPLSLLMCDIDYFKQYNDTYGHQAGDVCLKQIAAAISTGAQRSQDIVARYGGEEFVVLAPDVDYDTMLQIAQSIQAHVAQLQIPHKTSIVNPYVTLSIGVATMIPAYQEASEVLIGDADAACYAAKSQGRNCIVGQE